MKSHDPLRPHRDSGSACRACKGLNPLHGGGAWPGAVRHRRCDRSGGARNWVGATRGTWERQRMPRLDPLCTHPLYSLIYPLYIWRAWTGAITHPSVLYLCQRSNSTLGKTPAPAHLTRMGRVIQARGPHVPAPSSLRRDRPRPGPAVPARRPSPHSVIKGLRTRQLKKWV